MRNNFSARIIYDKKSWLAVIVQEHRKNGLYYEVNISGFPRFYMTWSSADRYDLVGEESLPYELVLAVSDAIENEVTK